MITVIALSLHLHGQVSLYEFSQTQETYVELSEAEAEYVLGEPEYWPQVDRRRAWTNNPYYYPAGQPTPGGYGTPAQGPGFPIGFDFEFNGDVFDRFGVSNAGWISFGKSSDGIWAIWIYNYNYNQGNPMYQWYNGPDVAYKRNRVSGFGNWDLQQPDWTSTVPPGPKGSVRIATIGTAPNRTCVIQFTDYGLAFDNATNWNLINFQIRLNENGNTVDVRFGPMEWRNLLGKHVDCQIGLAGRDSADYNGRRTIYEQPSFVHDWTNTVPITSNQQFCTMAKELVFNEPNSAILPPEGMNWRWTPPVCPPPVWPHIVSNVDFESATISWEGTAAAEYEYVLTTTNDPDGPVVDSGTTTDTELVFFGLDESTTYYFFIRSLCAGEPGVWSMGTSFTTIRGGMVACDGSAIDVTFCSHQNDSVMWKYISMDGSPLKIELYNGYKGQVFGEQFQIWDGVPGTGTLLYNQEAFTNAGGLSFIASSTVMTIISVTFAGACEAQEWYLPYEWRVGCKNCTDPLASFNTEEDCDNDQYFVNVDIFSMGSAQSLTLENTLNAPPVTVTSTGTHTVGPFPSGHSVAVTVQNSDNLMCHADSPVLMGMPCAVADCGPTTYTQCYGFNEFLQWAYQGENGQEIGLRFLDGNIGIGNDASWYNGADTEEGMPQTLNGILRNQLLTSGPPSTDNTIVLEIQSGTTQSCAEETMYGLSAAWEYVVACYDGCLQPKATFAANCVSPSQFEVVVNITDIGSTSSVQITNNGGAPAVTASTTGTFVTGPFPVGTPVTVEVEGASILCTWTSAGLVKNADDCLGTGIASTDAPEELRLFPNPGDGRFTMELPGTKVNEYRMLVRDLTGRIVAGQQLIGAGPVQVDLGHLPAGMYTVAVWNDDLLRAAKISILK